MSIESTILFYTNQLKTMLIEEEKRLSNVKIPTKGVRNVYNKVIEYLIENKNNYRTFLLNIQESIDNLGTCKEKIKNNETLQRYPIEHIINMDYDKIILQYTNFLKNSFIQTDSSVENEALSTSIDSCINNLQISKEIAERLLRGLDEKIAIINNQKLGTLEGLTRDTIKKGNIKPLSFVDEEILGQTYDESKHIGGKKKNKSKKRNHHSRRKQTLKKKTFRKYKR
jgi:hypothetical protein